MRGTTTAIASRPEPFAVEVQRRDGAAIVQPRGELDVATIQTLRATLDRIESAGRLVLDLRGLTFLDSTCLHLLVELDERAQRDGIRLTLVAPAPPVDRAIRLCGLDEALPFAPGRRDPLLRPNDERDSGQVNGSRAVAE